MVILKLAQALKTPLDYQFMEFVFAKTLILFVVLRINEMPISPHPSVQFDPAVIRIRPYYAWMDVIQC